ncbi:YraN family protein [Jannaschia sp. W003]|uniref:YraN family protein n=1 Tax=Jannaschia sp. W003 TaxID=2867012 RepID=UPI0021A2BBE2|nr:YraN family protein [Jannaschia sp. W003]UWQ22200.1 YraN family protein [Jannaschia sp. W003]
MGGSVAFHSGMAAEEAVARHYEARARTILARRWRGRGGEIDLVARDGAATVFVEVKRARTHARAAERLGAAQRGRIRAAAAEYLDTLPGGALSEARFDVALVDEAGRVAVLENVLL